MMFRFKLAPEPAPRSTIRRSFSLWKSIAFFLLGAGALFILVRLVFHWSGPDPNREPDTGPVVLALQKIGQLHTVSYTMKDVLRPVSEQEPEGWASSVPGVSNIVHWATHNQALVTAEGTVEAGLDLSRITPNDVTRIKQPDGTTRLRVHLPPVTLYPANVHIHVESSQPGLFYKDENLVARAQRQAEHRFTQAAEKDGIRVKAQENAIKLLQQVQRAFGQEAVEFQF